MDSDGYCDEGEWEDEEDDLEEIESDDENLESPEAQSTSSNQDASGLIPFSTDSSAKDGFKFECLPSDRILKQMSTNIQEVNEILKLDATTLRIILAHYKWDKEKLLEQYYEYEGNPDKIFKESHVINPFNNAVNKKKTLSVLQNSTCDICLTACLQNYMTGLACGHVFCKECWREYLTTKIMDEGMSQTISCPAFACDIIVDDQIVMNLLSSKRVRAKYVHLITNTFVECNSRLKWCPTPDCHHVIRVNFSDARPVKCDCGNLFCFKCSEHWHDPVLCTYLKKWVKKCDDDSETSNWIAANTKECPKCQVIIEKNGGCNHMICRNVNCRHEFCWVCLGNWTPHGSSWYSCNRYNADDAKKARDSQEESRQALQRYLFYCSRYMNHLQSLRFDNKGNQADLEKATETLSSYLERDITTDMQQEIKQKVQDKYRYCETRRKVLLSHVYEGYEKDLWEYME